MVKIAVVYHSGYGHTEQVAKVIAQASQASLHAISQEGTLEPSDWEVLNSADVIIFGSPTYMGMCSWQFKKFADESSKIWFTQGWKDKLFAGFTNSASMNGDKSSTLHHFFTLAMQHGGIWISAGIMPSSKKSSTRDDINYVGSFSGLMATTPSDAGVDEMIAGDLATAEAFAKRIITVANKLIG